MIINVFPVLHAYYRFEGHLSRGTVRAQWLSLLLAPYIVAVTGTVLLKHIFHNIIFSSPKNQQITARIIRNSVVTLCSILLS